VPSTCSKWARPESCSPTSTGAFGDRASTDAVELLELFQIQNDEGPCLDCFATGAVVCNDDLARQSLPRSHRVPPQRLSSRVRDPLRLRELILAASTCSLPDSVALSTGRCFLHSLADVASIAIVQDQATRQRPSAKVICSTRLTSRS